MKRVVIKNVYLFVLTMALSITITIPHSTEVYGADSTNSIKLVDNTYVANIKNTYMANTDSGYMRVICDDIRVYIEYYDQDFNMTDSKAIEMELSFWGGFYSGSDAYYLVQGNDNAECIDGTEVLRVIKYDKSWNRLGAGSILAQDGWEYEIRYPFDHSCVNMTEIDGNLYVVTGRQGYVDPKYGQGHQGMMLIRMNESNFNTEIVYGDFWHSFSQYIASDGSDIFLYEQSEGSRATMLSRFESSKTGTDYFDAFTERFSVLNYGGSRTSAWAIPCYATAKDIAISADNVLGIGTSIDQSKYDNYDSDTTPYNIYLTVTPKSNLKKEATNLIWLTDYKNKGKSFSGVTLTKINDNRFLVTWDEGDNSEKLSNRNDLMSGHRLHYVFIDGNGNKVSKEYVKRAAFSDCHPIVHGNNVVYHASSEDNINFYSINIDNGNFSNKIYNTVENVMVYGVDNKVYTGKSIKIKPTVYTSSSYRELESGKEYTISYTNNKNVGTAKAIIKGKGAFSGTKIVKFKILPKSTTLKSVKPGKKSFTVEWKKQAKQVTGYEIQYTVGKSFKKGTKTVIINKAKTTKKTIKKLKSHRKYNVRIRTYKDVQGKIYYSKWSKAKSITVK